MRDNQQGLHFLYHNRKLLIAAAILGAIAGFGRTLFIPKKYMSTAIIYPVNSHERNNLVSNPQFGFEVETEHLLQLLESQTMRERTVNEFELFDYYNLDTNDREWRSELTRRYVSDVNFLRSKYLSVVINVTSTSPKLASKIANFQVDEVDRYRETVFKENREEEYKYVLSQYELSKERLSILSDSIYAVKGGEKELIAPFLENLNNENYDASSFINDPKLESLIERYRFELDTYRALRKDSQNKKRELAQPMPKVYSIDRAIPSYQAVSPSIPINTLLGAMLFFSLSLSLKLAFDRSKKLKPAHESA